MNSLSRFFRLSASLLFRRLSTNQPRVKNFHKLVFVGFTIYHTVSQNIGCLQDKPMSEARKTIDTAISKMKSEFGQMAVYPEVKMALRGNTYSFQFTLDQRKCDLFEVLASFLSNFPKKQEFRITNSNTIKEENLITMQLDFEEKDPRTKTPNKGCVTITGILNDERPSFRLVFQKNDVITESDKKAIIKSYKQSIRPRDRESTSRQHGTQTGKDSGSTPFSFLTTGVTKNSKSANINDENMKKLEQLGVTIFHPHNKQVNLDWDYLAGYEKQKRDIEDTVLLALSHPQIYDDITEGTRVKNEPNRPKAILFEGPPGTGKTTSAKIIAQQVQIPLIYMPIQAIMSKYYGQSEKKFADLWQACKNMGKVIIFIDEIDALAGSRSNDMHEASRRILSTLLRKIDSFESTTDVLLICATNRKRDLDPAMLSRIDLSIKFELPDQQSRAAIFKRYAKQLSDKQRTQLAGLTEGMSGRNIADICKSNSDFFNLLYYHLDAERRWASKLIRMEVSQKLPDLEAYVDSLQTRKENQLE